MAASVDPGDRRDPAMLIGILSDSHGRVETTRAAVAALRERGAEMLPHLGDIGDDAVIDELIGHNARIVFGNCDWDIAGLTHYAGVVGVKVEHPMGIVTADGRRIAFTHGHLPQFMQQAMDQGVDYLFHGHTHELRDERVKGVRIINPGALCRATRYTAAVLDPAVDRLTIVEIART